MKVETLLLVVLGVCLMLVPFAVGIAVAVIWWSTAEQRSDELLRAVLTEEEYHQLTRRGHVDIPSPGDPARVYRVPRYAGRVQVRENGAVTEWLCLQPAKWVPDADLVAIHKLMIQGDEEMYLQTANRRTVSYPL